MRSSSPESAFREALVKHNIDLALSVPCKYIAELIQNIADDTRFSLIYPSREEEGLGIAAGAYLSGRKSVMLIQNSGLGTMVNAYCSLNQFYQIPVCLLVSSRGDETERVPAQVPMGTISTELLKLMGIACISLDLPQDLCKVDDALSQYCDRRESVAFLAKRAFWTP